MRIDQIYRSETVGKGLKPRALCDIFLLHCLPVDFFELEVSQIRTMRCHIKVQLSTTLRTGSPFLLSSKGPLLFNLSLPCKNAPSLSHISQHTLSPSPHTPQ